MTSTQYHARAFNHQVRQNMQREPTPSLHQWITYMRHRLKENQKLGAHRQAAHNALEIAMARRELSTRATPQEPTP